MLVALLLGLAQLGLAQPVSAQVSGPPFTFVAGTVADPNQVNTNFNTIYTNALNRTGGTMTGTLTSQQITPAADNTYDLAASAAMMRSIYAKTSLVLGQTGGNYTLTWANPAAARAISIPDPGGTDTFVFAAMTQTLTNKTLTAPVLSGTATCSSCNEALTNAANTFTVANNTFAGITINGGSAAAGAILKSSGAGLYLQAITGSVNDFQIANPAGSQAVLSVPTGTLNTQFGGNILMPSVAVTFSGSTAATGPSIFDNSNILHIRGGSGGVKIQNSAGGTDLMTMSDAGLLTVLQQPIVASFGIRTSSGNTSVATATATTLFTIPATTAGTWSLAAYLNNGAGDATYLGKIDVVCDLNSHCFAVENASASGNLTLAVSGLNIQVTQNSGSTQTIGWSVTKYNSQ